MNLYKENTADLESIKNHIRKCAFDPPLETYVEVDEYLEKILTLAHRFECWVEGELSGFCALYCNSPEKEKAFITLISVTKQCSGKGIASSLLQKAITHSRQLGFQRIGLEVKTSNEGAIRLYEKTGFKIQKNDSRLLTMSLKLESKHD